MHNLTKIKIFRTLLYISRPFCWLLFSAILALREKKKEKLFFFFDRFAIGGAQKVHLDILESVADLPKAVFFTRFSPNDKLKSAFYDIPNTSCLDIHLWCDWLVFRLFSVHFYSMMLNRAGNVKVLGANSTFFYDMLPFLRRNVEKIELLHNFSGGKNGMEFFGLANYADLDQRLVIDAATRQNIIDQYRRCGVADIFQERVSVIEFGVTIPAPSPKAQTPPLEILYAGRGTAQKRVWLLNLIAENFIGQSNRPNFSFAGPLTGELSAKVQQHYGVLGEIGDPGRMADLFRKAHVVILTSAFEGFPVVIKEAMAHGCIPLVPALEGIITHLRDGDNAILIDHPEHEEALVSKSIEMIKLLSTDESLRNQLSAAAYEYARTHFTKQVFLAAYRKLLTNYSVV